VTPELLLGPEELATLLADSADGSYFELDRRPLPAVSTLPACELGFTSRSKGGSLPSQ
jgi:hypothetical protein